MSFSNPLQPVYSAYLTSRDCFKVFQRIVREQHEGLISHTQFANVADNDKRLAISEASEQAADLVVLALFATFERFIIDHLQLANERLSVGYPTEYSQRLANKFRDEVEFWKLDSVLDLFKGEIDSALMGRAKQIKDYRDWIAHRNPKRTPAVQIEPDVAFEVLSKIIGQIRNKHTPLPEQETAMAAAKADARCALPSAVHTEALNAAGLR
jgi:hypothetical protein